MANPDRVLKPLSGFNTGAFFSNTGVLYCAYSDQRDLTSSDFSFYLLKPVSFTIHLTMFYRYGLVLQTRQTFFAIQIMTVYYDLAI